MDVWFIIPLFLLIGGIFYFFWKRIKQIQSDLLRETAQVHAKDAELQSKDVELQTKDVELQTKDVELQTKDVELQTKVEKLTKQTQELEKIKTEKGKLEAKYQKKVKAAETKKNNLAKYHETQKDTRTLRQQTEDIVGKGPKWLPHSCCDESSPRIGKPPGGKGAGRLRPEKIHETRDLMPITCPCCQADLTLQKAYFVYDAIITDLSHDPDEVGAYKVLRLKNICQRIHRRKCPICDHWIYPNQGLFKNARFGIGFICYVLSQRILLNLTYLDIILNLCKLFGIRILVSETAIIDWFLKFEAQISAIYSQLEQMLQDQTFVHMDETGLPMIGENWWLWVVCTANLVLYHQSTGRGHSDIEEVLKGFEGTIIADFFRAYEKFDSNAHQKCLAHLLSAIIELMVKLEKEDERMALKILKHEEVLAREKADAEALPGTKTRGRKPKGDILTPEQMDVLERRNQENQKTLGQAERLGTFFRAPFKDTCYNWKKPLTERITKEAAEKQLDELIQTLRMEGITNEELDTLVKRCEKFRNELFTYLEHDDMPPDNNPAERNLRKFTKQRKISGDFKSPEVGKHFVAYLSLFMTCKLNDRDFDQLLHSMLAGESVDLRTFLMGKK